jgi:hypothetical protein
MGGSRAGLRAVTVIQIDTDQGRIINITGSVASPARRSAHESAGTPLEAGAFGRTFSPRVRAEGLRGHRFLKGLPAVAPLLLVSALLHAYVGWRLVPALPADPAWAWALGVLLAASAWLTPTALLARRRHRHLGSALVWAGLLCMGLFSSLFVLTLARDAVWLLAGLADALIGVLPVPRAPHPGKAPLCSTPARSRCCWRPRW